MTSKITKEQLIEKLQHRIAVAANYPDVEEAELDATIFKIALDSIQQEPIGAFHIANQQVDGTSDYIKDGDWPIDDGVIEVYAAPKTLTGAERAELEHYRKAATPELKPANLINKFYERYPLAGFKTDGERSEALGYFMAGAELQCFGEFVKYEDLCRDE